MNSKYSHIPYLRKALEQGEAFMPPNRFLSVSTEHGPLIFWYFQTMFAGVWHIPSGRSWVVPVIFDPEHYKVHQEKFLLATSRLSGGE